MVESLFDESPVIMLYSPCDKAMEARLSAFLKSERFTVVRCREIPESLDRISMAIICDGGVIAPEFAAIERLRYISDIPLMTVSHSCDEIYRTVALDKGADICLSADSLGRNEFTARTAAMLRRYLYAVPKKKPLPDTIVNGSLEADRRRREFFVSGKPVSLTSTQFGIVEYLMENCGRVCSVEDIYRSVWHETPYGIHRTVVDHIRRIRCKIEPDPHNPRYIKSVFGAGYKIEQAMP